MKVGDLVRLLPPPPRIITGPWRAAAHLTGKSGLILRRVPVGYKNGLPVYAIHREMYEGHHNPDCWWVLLEGEVIELREAGLETISESR